MTFAARVRGARKNYRPLFACCGMYSYRDPYFMEFFARITIEADFVTIDVNGHKKKN